MVFAFTGVPSIKEPLARILSRRSSERPPEPTPAPAN